MVKKPSLQLLIFCSISSPGGCLVRGVPGQGVPGLGGDWSGVPGLGGAWSGGCLVCGGAWPRGPVWRPPRRLLLRAVCILLECILVFSKMNTTPLYQYSDRTSTGYNVTGSNLLCKQHIVLNHMFFRYKSPGS